MDMRHEIILGATCDILTLVTWDNLVFKIDIQRMGAPSMSPNFAVPLDNPSVQRSEGMLIHSYPLSHPHPKSRVCKK